MTTHACREHTVRVIWLERLITARSELPGAAHLVNVSSRLLYAIARPSVCCLSVTVVRRTHAVEIVGNFLRHLFLWPYFSEIVPGEPLRRGS